MEDFLTFLFVCIVGGVVGLPAFIILLFWARPERWTFKSFAFGWLLGSHGYVVRLCTCGLSGNGGGRVGEGVLMRCYPLSLLLA